MKRREFLVRVAIGGATMPLIFRQLGCSDDGGTGPDTTAETFSSLPDGTGHSHTIIIPDADIAGGGDHTYTASNVGHTHEVQLSADEIDRLSLGCSVTKESSENAGHRHVWLIHLPDLASDITAQSDFDLTGHRHSMTVPAADMNDPTGVRNYTTTSASGHTHTVVVTPDQLIDLRECDSVIVESLESDGHTHIFQLVRLIPPRRAQ